MRAPSKSAAEMRSTRKRLRQRALGQGGVCAASVECPPEATSACPLRVSRQAVGA